MHWRVIDMGARQCDAAGGMAPGAGWPMPALQHGAVRDARPLLAPPPPLLQKPGGKVEIPWKLLLSKPATWALIVSHFCHNWGTFILLTVRAGPVAEPPTRRAPGCAGRGAAYGQPAALPARPQPCRKLPLVGFWRSRPVPNPQCTVQPTKHAGPALVRRLNVSVPAPPTEADPPNRSPPPSCSGCPPTTTRCWGWT